jgi:hypothetical protein
MTDFKGMPALDAGLVAAAQAVERTVTLWHVAHLGGRTCHAGRRCSSGSNIEGREGDGFRAYFAREVGY